MAFTPTAPIDLHAHAASTSWMTGVAADYPAGYEVPFHRHDRGQLLYALDGVLVVEATTGRWIVPPTTAVWLRPEVEHRLVMRGPVRVRSVLVATSAIQGMPNHDCVVHVSPLMRELVAEAASLATDVCSTRRGKLLASLLVEEMRNQKTLPFHLPWPSDRRMAEVCREVTNDPAHPFFAEEWAASLAMSTKTFHRHFKRSTGMNFGQWRQQAKLLAALDLVLQGQPLIRVALDTGYESHSAFTLAFKRHFGMPPSKFFHV
ncbi:MAG: helix-turn-helix transcriptional regulator [Burkholderiales bacterium]|nr:helix-turn-helix transcriptional regulator [Burkholderiales bacterium]